MGLLESFIVYGVRFGRRTVGLVMRPYETYRRIAEDGSPAELGFVAMLLVWYFVIASVVRVSAFRPFLLTKQFMALSLGAASGAMLAVLLIAGIGRLMRSSARTRVVAVAWGYTLIPTVLWFLSTSVLYVILPPPRTTSAAGILFSLLFLVFSATLLWWKITLAYLTLRFTLRFDLGKSLILAAISFPFVTAWSVAMYKLGIFKVPFI